MFNASLTLLVVRLANRKTVNILNIHPEKGYESTIHNYCRTLSWKLNTQRESFCELLCFIWLKLTKFSIMKQMNLLAPTWGLHVMMTYYRLSMNANIHRFSFWLTMKLSLMFMTIFIATNVNQVETVSPRVAGKGPWS